VLGSLAMACASSSTPSGEVDRGGAGGTSLLGDGGTAPDGTGGTAAAGAAGTGSAGGSSAGGSSSGGSGELTEPPINYEPVGLGDPWFFGAEAEVSAFTLDYENATGAKSWNAVGELRAIVDFPAAGSKAFIHFSAPWDSVANAAIPMNLEGRVLKASVRVASSTASGGAQTYSQSTTGWIWVSGDWNDFSSLGTWHDIELELDASADPRAVLRFGIQLYANGPGSTEFVIDDIRLEPNTAPPVELDGGVPPGDADTGGGSPADPDAGPLLDAGGGGLGYAPVGIGDPWSFDTESEFSAFNATPGYMSNTTLGTVSWSDGQIHIPMTFPAAGDTLEVQFETPYDGNTNVADLSQRVMRARVRFASGATATGGIQGFSQSGGWSWNSDGWVDLASLGSFADVSYDFSARATNAASVQRFGLQVYANSAGDAELIIDEIRLEPVP